MFYRGAWLGRVVLNTGHLHWGADQPVRTYNPHAEPPFFGLWYALSPDGNVVDSGRVGPFHTVAAAVEAASREAFDAGVTQIGQDGWIRVLDRTGYSVGPVNG